MIITTDKKFIKAPFINESEIENVVITIMNIFLGQVQYIYPKH